MTDRMGPARIVAAVFALLCAAAPAAAEDYDYILTGSQLHDLCQANPDEAHFWAIGFNDGLAMAAELHALERVCLPDEAGSHEIRDIACKAVAADLETRHLPASFTAFIALEAAWPCP